MFLEPLPPRVSSPAGAECSRLNPLSHRIKVAVFVQHRDHSPNQTNTVLRDLEYFRLAEFR
jgi:hypothetical protein